MIKIFVYGTLKPGEENYAKYCAGKVIDTKPAYALGELFALPQGYPAMIKGDNRVYGYLLTFTDVEVLTELDELEDYHPFKQNSENLYNREQIKIFTLESKNLESKIGIPSLNQGFWNQALPEKAKLGLAWVYLMSEYQINQLNGMRKTDGWWSGNNISIDQITCPID
jgi:gamma-glutamylcyclotransferase (GGCT)/AIG2-like uncharacterized protein YtfP